MVVLERKEPQIGGPLLDFLEVVVARTMFCLLLASFCLFGMGSLVGYPGAFVLIAFSLGGLPTAVFVTSRTRWLVAGITAALTCTLPFWLLLLYTGDGDFTVPSLIMQYIVLASLSYGLAWLGLILGHFVWA